MWFHRRAGEGTYTYSKEINSTTTGSLVLAGVVLSQDIFQVKFDLLGPGGCWFSWQTSVTKSLNVSCEKLVLVSFV